MIFATLRLVSTLFFRSLGHLFFYLFKKRRKIAVANVQKCFSFLHAEKKCTPKKVNKIVKQSFAGLGQNLSDFLLLRSSSWRYVASIMARADLLLP